MYMSKMHASCGPHSAQDSLFFHTLQHPFLLNIFDWLLTILVTSQKVRVEFIRKDFIKGSRLNSERLYSYCNSIKALIRL